MAHNLNETNGKVSFAAVGEKAWHGLGTYVQEAMTAEQAIDLGGLGYEVIKTKIQTSGKLQVIPGYMATVRKDTWQHLGIVSDKYHVVQNRDMFGFMDSIIERGEAIYQTAGALGNGERIFITAKLPDDILVHGEKIEKYLLLTSGHDGKTPIQVGFTPIRVVCNNTLTAALRGLQSRLTILHFKNAEDKLKTAARVMGLASKYAIEVEGIFNKMADVKIDESILKQYIETVLLNETISEEKLKKEHSTLFANRVKEITEFALTHPTQLTEAAKGTVWGAYNSISGYYSYVKKYKSQEEKMDDVYFKAGAKKIEKAFELAVNLM